MIRQGISLLRIVLDKRITAVPVRVLRELRSRGIRRLPRSLDVGIGGRVPALKAAAFLWRWLGSEMPTRHKGQWVLNSFTPPFPGPAFDRAFENLLSGRRFSPISAFLSVTADCPYSCWHCSLARRRTGRLTTGQWVHAIEELQGLGAGIIGFTGGEPLTRGDLPGLVRAAAEGGAATIVFTSGAHATAETVGKLADAGLWSMCVSLDEEDRERHDRLRGAPGAYDGAIEAIRLSKAHGLYTMIGAVATAEFAENRRFESLYALARREKVDEVRIVEPMPCGNIRGNKDLLLTKEHIKAIRDFHVSTNRKGRPPKLCAFNQIESPEVFGCAGGIQHLFVDPAGKVCPCDFTPLSFGNLTSEPLSDIWTRMNGALGRPRRNCMLQTHHELFAEYYDKGYPLPKDSSLEVCKKMKPEPLPAYYEMVLAGTPETGGGETAAPATGKNKIPAAK